MEGPPGQRGQREDAVLGELRPCAEVEVGLEVQWNGSRDGLGWEGGWNVKGDEGTLEHLGYGLRNAMG